MYGSGLIKGMGVTFKHFVESYVEDLKYAFRGGRYNDKYISARQGPKAKGIFTVQYPEGQVKTLDDLRAIPLRGPGAARPARSHRINAGKSSRHRCWPAITRRQSIANRLLKYFKREQGKKSTLRARRLFRQPQLRAARCWKRHLAQPVRFSNRRLGRAVASMIP